MSGLVEQYLQKQQTLSAVEKFSVNKDLLQLPENSRLYTDLIPKNTPGPGEQYAFEVNLDQCSGCKACVTACHSENGLEEDESWRYVGLLQGGNTNQPEITHVTTACHHCLDPACLNGCPVNAYVKKPDTGIVKHLDDQCFGCQYCTFTCVYSVPKYSKKKGIVHKCDMCISRLQVGQAPACVRACPGGAIRIRIVDSSNVRKDPDAFVKVPHAPDSTYTLPTTKYIRKKEFAGNSVCPDFYELKTQHAHWPLVVMLVLTQLSTGTFVALWVLSNFVQGSAGGEIIGYHCFTALAFGLLGMTASVFHLGRPLLAFRAVLGLRKSWLSREIAAFGIFAPSAVLAILMHKNWAIALAAGFGLLGVFCSVMVYRYTKRPFWDQHATTLKFFLTTGILGVMTGQWSTALFFQIHPDREIYQIQSLTGGFWMVLAVMALIKFAVEAKIFLRLKDREWSSLKQTALLMKDILGPVSCARFILGALAAIVCPLVMVLYHPRISAVETFWGVSVMLVLTLAAELMERYLFFTTVVPLQMPKVTPHNEKSST